MEWNKVAEFKMPSYFLLFTPFYHFARHSLTFEAEWWNSRDANGTFEPFIWDYCPERVCSTDYVCVCVCVKLTKLYLALFFTQTSVDYQF